MSPIFRCAASARRAPVAYSVISRMRWKGLSAASIRRATSSWLSTCGRWRTFFGYGVSAMLQPLQHVNIEEAQRSQPQDHCVGTELQLGEEHRLILANVLRAKLIGPAAEVPAEVLHPVEVRADGCIGEVAASQLLKHDLT